LPRLRAPDACSSGLCTDDEIHYHAAETVARRALAARQVETINDWRRRLLAQVGTTELWCAYNAQEEGRDGEPVVHLRTYCDGATLCGQAVREMRPVVVPDEPNRSERKCPACLEPDRAEWITSLRDRPRRPGLINPTQVRVLKNGFMNDVYELLDPRAAQARSHLEPPRAADADEKLIQRVRKLLAREAAIMPPIRQRAWRSSREATPRSFCAGS